MIGVQLSSELMERPFVLKDGSLEMKLRGMRIIANADTKLSGCITSVDGLLQIVRVGDMVDVQGYLAAVSRVSAIQIRVVSRVAMKQKEASV